MNVVVISGGSSGIGQACVEKFLSMDYFVYNLDILTSAVTHQGYKWLNVDIKNHTAIKAAIETIIKESHKIDSLIASAGKHLSADIETTTDEQLFDVVNLNIFGVYWLIQAVIPYMKKQNKGSIVTLGSDQSTIAKSNSAVYGMTKAAVCHLTKSTALDYAKYNIRANCIGAGSIDTPLFHRAVEKYSERSKIPLAEIEKSEALEQPLGRVGKPHEVAELAYFLAEDTSSFTTGALIPIDGGYIIK